MKGVILAGGLGSRLAPLTFVTNKHLLPVYDKPMIYYPLETMRKAGITDVMVVIGGPHAGHFIPLLKNGEDFGMSIRYSYQEEEGGIAEALSLTEGFADGESIFVVLGDNITERNFMQDVITMDHSSLAGNACIFLKETKMPENFGVVEWDSGKLVSIIEKPKNPPSNQAVLGMYFFPYDVYTYIKKLSYSERGELEVTDLNNIYIKKGKMIAITHPEYWSDCGSFDTMLSTSLYMKQLNEK
ncbi:NTP transferase domain-containing protein [Candidatus Woesearchaeota archaeon]|jgi:glucose-1-phosphate thymidylyltransferase|nr:NTP transferase domain-containing protein [Candidatus Woesearchaeota archaeon]